MSNDAVSFTLRREGESPDLFVNWLEKQKLDHESRWKSFIIEREQRATIRVQLLSFTCCSDKVKTDSKTENKKSRVFGIDSRKRVSCWVV